MGRPPKGSVIWQADKAGVERWHVRVTMPDGSRPAHPLPTSIPRENEQLARIVGAKISDAIRSGAVVPIGDGETTSEWFGRFYDSREANGQTSVKDSRARFKNWIDRHIGRIAPTRITRRDVEAIVTALDAAVREGRICGRPPSTFGAR
jgi:hypothetical protein